MRDTAMIKIDDHEIFKNNLSTLKETSKDIHDGVDFMTESEIEVVNFNGVKNDYIKDLHVSDTPKSNDALYVGKENKLVFIEFKNGKINDIKEFDIRRKIFDSLLILMDIIKETAAFTRNHLTYILVYNEERNSQNQKNSTNVQDSKSKLFIGSHFAHKGGKKFIRFDLEKFEKLYFKEVYTYTEKEFEDNFVSKCAVG